MKSFKKKGSLVGLFLGLTLLASCGGGSSSSSKKTSQNSGNNGGGDTETQTQSGQFVGSSVAGLRYESGAEEGVTQEDGVFSCEVGQTVSFYLDQDGTQDILLGQVACRSVVSPIELMTNGEQNITVSVNSLEEPGKQRVINMLRLVQSLDLDRNPNNGIYLESSVMSDVSTYLSTNAPQGEASSSIQTMMNLNSSDFSVSLNNMLTAVGRPNSAVTEASAIAHFEAFRQNCTTESCQAPNEDVPETQYVCLSGYSLMAETDIYASIVDTLTGQLWAAFEGQAELSSTLVVLYENEEARIYRRAHAGALFGSQNIFSNGADYTSFDSSWAFNAEAETMTVEDAPFRGEDADWTFEGVTNLGVSSVTMSDMSSGVNTQSDTDLQAALTIWTVKYNCTLPAEDDSNNLGDGSEQVE